MAEKTQNASVKKLTEARKSGKVAHSAELRVALSFASVLALLYWALGAYWPGVAAAFRLQLAQWVRGSDIPAASLCARLLLLSALGVLPLLLAALVVKLVALWQTRGMVSLQLVRPDLKRIHPIVGFAKFFSLRTVSSAGVMLLRLAWVLGLSAWTVYLAVLQAPRLWDASPAGWWLFFLTPTIQLGTAFAGGTLLLGLLDQGLQLWLFQRDMRQDLGELRRDLRETEGDPLQKAVRRGIALRDAAQPLPQLVQRASVMVTNPQHRAVLLRYAPQDDAPIPVLLHKACGHEIAALRRWATDYKVPVLAWPPLARRLYDEVEAGQTIPADLFIMVAQLLVWVQQLQAAQAHGQEFPADPARSSVA